MKKILFTLYIVVILCMGIATFVEKYRGTSFVSTYVYGAWWFSLLWALLTAVAIVWFVKRRVKRISVVLLHLSFVIILAGAFLTHLTAHQGMMHLRIGQTENRFRELAGEEIKEWSLPFSVRLNRFEVKYHEGTRAAADYISSLTIIDGNEQEDCSVSMNHIFSRHHTRLYQSSYDDDGQGSYLSVNSDPYGIPVTYLGYALLFLSLVWMLFDPRGAYRKIVRGEGVRSQEEGDGSQEEGERRKEKGDGRKEEGVSGLLSSTSLKICLSLSVIALFMTLLILFLPHRQKEEGALPVLPEETAKEFGKLNILYNDRICPLQTFALDFTKKLYGKRSYKGYSAEQVLTGFIFWGDEWSKEPVIKMKSGVLRNTLQLPEYCAVNTFFNSTMGGYILGPYIREYYQGENDKFHQEAAKIDDKLQLVMELRRGKLLQVFPYQSEWYAPIGKYPAHMEEERQQYMRNIFSILNEEAHAGHFSQVDEAIAKMQKYQRTFGSNMLPSSLKVTAERLYNRVPFATFLFMLNLTLGFLCLVPLFRKKGNVGKEKRKDRITGWVILFSLSFLTLTICLILRWIISGTVPMSNGYETMLLMAWMIMILSLLTFRRFPIILSFGFLMSGFFLLVSHISQMDPQISHIMPVLSSPLLTFHVSIIMMAFALLALTFICGITGIVSRGEGVTKLSKLFLYPALTCLGFGIFIGAIWANVSWGTYWSWDPKEVWALITFMVYAVAVHDRSVPWLQKPFNYHLFMVLAFLTILMTYFGVNYFLGGMHSYA